MIRCLPSRPSYSCVSLTDWMISLIFRSYTEPSNAVSGRSRARTSCWVIVEPPRGWPVRVSIAAETQPPMSNPGLVQKSAPCMGGGASRRCAWASPAVGALDGPCAVQHLRRALVGACALAAPLPEGRKLDLAGPIED